MVLMICADSKHRDCLGFLLSALPQPAGPGSPTTHAHGPTLATSSPDWMSLHFYPPVSCGSGLWGHKVELVCLLIWSHFYPLFSSTYYKVGMVLKRLARPLHEDTCKFMKYSVCFFISYYRDTYKPCLLTHFHNNQNTEPAQMHGPRKRDVMWGWW